jgi:hypothetical protein
MGQKTFALGIRQPQANLVKFLGNFLIAANIECLGEAFALARKSAIEPHRFLEILTGTLFTAPLYHTYGTMIADERYEPAGFKMALALKDMRLALAAADTTAVPMPTASLVHDQWRCLGQGEADWSSLARLCARCRALNRPTPAVKSHDSFLTFCVAVKNDGLSPVFDPVLLAPFHGHVPHYFPNLRSKLTGVNA